MRRTFLPWLLFLGLMLGLVSAASAQTTRAPGRIVLAKLRGEVSLTDNATKAVKSAVGVKDITQGWTVTTGPTGSVVLVFSNGSTVNLGRDSVLNIETFLQDPLTADMKVADATAEPTTSVTKLSLARGELVGNVKKLNADRGSTFDVATPVGAAGIRGTTFRIVFRPDPVNPGVYNFSLSTLEGEVQVSLSGSTTAVPVAVGTNKEVTVDVQVTIDPVTQAITIVAPPQIVNPPADMSGINLAAVTQATQEAVQAAETTVFTTPPPGSGNATGNATNSQTTGSGDNNGSPESQRQNTTTNGDGQSQNSTTSGDNRQ